MRRRYDDVPPEELLVFDGRGYETAADYEAAADAFFEARERWRLERGLPDHAMPDWKSIGDCPWDPSWI
jgi:hypothetical protein